MADKANEKGWPLMVTNALCDTETMQERGAESLRAQFDMLYHMARKKLEEEGCLGDVRRLTLFCHNKDEDITEALKYKPQKEKK